MMFPAFIVWQADELIPYVMHQDNLISILLVGCFFVLAFVLSQNRRFLLQLMDGFLMNRRRASIFTTSTTTEVNNLFLLILMGCVFLGVCIYYLSLHYRPELVGQVNLRLLLGIYVLLVVVYLLLKWMLYAVVGWVFFNREMSGLWMEAYSTLIYYACFYLFLLASALVYFELPLQTGFWLLLFMFVLVRLFIFYKWIKLFSVNFYGLFLLFLYFCALEITPCLLLAANVMIINSLLIT